MTEAAKQYLVAEELLLLGWTTDTFVEATEEALLEWMGDEWPDMDEHERDAANERAAQYAAMNLGAGDAL